MTLPDPAQFLSSTAVQIEAAKLLSNPDVKAVTDSVTGTVDPTTGALTITASASTPEEAKATAEAYSQAYVDQTQVLIQKQINKITTLSAGVESQIQALQAQPLSTLDHAQINALTTTYGSLAGRKGHHLARRALRQHPGGRRAAGSTGGTEQEQVGADRPGGRSPGRLRHRPGPRSARHTSPQQAGYRIGDRIAHPGRAPRGQRGAERLGVHRHGAGAPVADGRIGAGAEDQFAGPPRRDTCPLIVVTSPEPGDGKTFVTANLAAAWAMSGSKVIVVSADFRRPRLEEIFGLEVDGRPGLADLIRANWKKPDVDDRVFGQEDRDRYEKNDDRSGRSGPRTPNRGRRDAGPVPDQPSASSLLVETGIWGLQILPAGTKLDNPSELFGSPGMQPVLDQLPLLADIILLDTPPILSAPDTAIIGSMARNAVVVASENRTDRGDLERTVRRLETTHCHVLGIAINRVKRTSVDSYRAYHYKQ